MLSLGPAVNGKLLAAWHTNLKQAEQAGVNKLTALARFKDTIAKFAAAVIHKVDIEYE